MVKINKKVKEMTEYWRKKWRKLKKNGKYCRKIDKYEGKHVKIAEISGKNSQKIKKY